MPAFVVVTENYYGGENDLKVFRQKSDADRFATTISSDIDRIVIETALPTNSDKVFITVTEEYYGGGSDKIRIFKTREEAEVYGESVNENGKLDTLALERVVE